jgi:uncharacterized protein (DUF58 family)
MATTTPNGARRTKSDLELLDPAVLSRIGGLELIARSVVDGFLGGVHRAPTFGATTDFAEHRGYMPGDDPRRVDWRLFARSDRLHVKEYEADSNANVVVLLDVSRSMDWTGSPGRLTKLDYGRVLAASILWLARQQRDRVGLATFDDRLRELVPPSGKHLPMALHVLEQTRAGGAGDLTGPLRAVADHVRRRGIVAVVSDLYAEPATAVDAVLQLRNRGSELLLLHVLDPTEREFPSGDVTGLRDLETGETLPVVSRMMRDEYRALVAAHVAELDRLAAARGITYAQIDTTTPPGEALARVLSLRERLGPVRHGV